MLLIHTALHAEANALIRHFKLKRLHTEHAFACFMADDIWLIESGIGKINAATAVAWLSAKSKAENPIWLNIGIAGHATMTVGNLVRANRIEDNASRQRWYPPNLTDDSPDSCSLLCIDQEVSGYPDHAMIDMETSGFISAANRFTTLELIQSLKVISDNQENPPRRFKKQEVDGWISEHLETITRYADQLQQLRQEILDTTGSENQALLDRTHFSQYQKTALHRLVQRYQALYPEQCLLDHMPADLGQAKKIISWLEETISQATIAY